VLIVNIAIVVGNALLVYFVYHALIVMIAKAVFLLNDPELGYNPPEEEEQKKQKVVNIHADSSANIGKQRSKYKLNNGGS
jgi:hypothetical protein